MTESEIIETHIQSIKESLKQILFKVIEAEFKIEDNLFHLVNGGTFFLSNRAHIFGLEIDYLDITRPGLVFDIDAIGNLKHTFDQYNVPPKFTAIFACQRKLNLKYSEKDLEEATNFHSQEAYIDSMEDLLDSFQEIDIYLNQQKKQWSAKQLEDFANSIESFRTFALMSDTSLT